MDKVDVGVRLQEIAPHALAGMRFAGDEQHAQLVAHAVDVDHGAVAVGRKFPLDWGDLELDHVDAGVFDRRLHLDPLAGLGAHRGDRLAVAAYSEADRRARTGAVDDARDDRLVLADDAIARRLDQLDPPLALALMAGDQGVQRRIEPKRGGGAGNVVDVAVGDHDRAADPLERRVGERVAQGGEQARAFDVGIGPRGFDDTHVHVAERL